MHEPLRALLAGLILLAPIGAAQSPTPPLEPAAAARADDLAAQIDEILVEYDDAYQVFMTAYRAAQTDEERSTAFESHFPKAEAFAARLWPILEADPDDPATVPALKWLFQNDYAEQERAAAMLLEHHMASEAVLVVCSAYTTPTPKSAETLALIIERSPHAAVKGYATICMGQHLMAVAEKVREIQDAEEEERALLAERFGEEAIVLWMDADADEVSAQAEATLERVRADYGDLAAPHSGTLGESASAILFELRHLQVGMIAPDIEGQDLDGVSFKLSDYRGKVVVLDFWGHW